MKFGDEFLGKVFGEPRRCLFEPPYDFLELYSGVGNMTQAWDHEGFRVLPPIELKNGWDMEDGRLFWGLLQFLRAGKLRFLWWAPPCTTFSLARTPKLRRLNKPWGIQVLDLFVLRGNLHAGQAILLAIIQVMVGHYQGGEQPGYGFMRATHAWMYLTQLEGVFEILFDWCRYQREHKKTTRLVVNFAPFRKLAKRCNHRLKHPKLEGSATTQASVYSPTFCGQVAKLWKQFTPNFGDDPPGWTFGDKDGVDSNGSFLGTPKPKVRQKAGSQLWAVQLSESSPWKTWIQYGFKSHEHINLQETKARRSLFKRLPPHRRVVVAQDSRVNLGSLGKGRSPSESLNRVMRSEAPWILGKNLYVAGVHFPTWSIRADCPSRFSPVTAPRAPVPSWFWKLRSGDRQAGLELNDLEGLPRSYNRWFLFASVLLEHSAGDSTSASQSTAAFSGAHRAGAHYSQDLHSQKLPPGSSDELVGRPCAGFHPRGTGPLSHRQFVGMVGRIHDSLVSRWPYETDGCRKLERDSPEIWLAQNRACRALEGGKDLGVLGAKSPPSACAETGGLCSCGYCAGLAVASSCSPFAARLFWFVETIRAYHAAERRLVTTHRPLGRRHLVHQDRRCKNPTESCPRPTRESRGTSCGAVDCADVELNSLVESYLERLLGSLQDEVGPFAAGSLT